MKNCMTRSLAVTVAVAVGVSGVTVAQAVDKSESVDGTVSAQGTTVTSPAVKLGSLTLKPETVRNTFPTNVQMQWGITSKKTNDGWEHTVTYENTSDQIVISEMHHILTGGEIVRKIVEKSHFGPTYTLTPTYTNADRTEFFVNPGEVKPGGKGSYTFITKNKLERSTPKMIGVKDVPKKDTSAPSSTETPKETTSEKSTEVTTESTSTEKPTDVTSEPTSTTTETTSKSAPITTEKTSEKSTEVTTEKTSELTPTTTEKTSEPVPVTTSEKPTREKPTSEKPTTTAKPSEPAPATTSEKPTSEKPTTSTPAPDPDKDERPDLLKPFFSSDKPLTQPQQVLLVALSIVVALLGISSVTSLAGYFQH